MRYYSSAFSHQVFVFCSSLLYREQHTLFVRTIETFFINGNIMYILHIERVFICLFRIIFCLQFSLNYLIFDRKTVQRSYPFVAAVSNLISLMYHRHDNIV